jgi:hypothetical protein
VVEFGKLCGSQEREHMSQGLSPGTLDLSQQTSTFVAQPAIDHAPVVGSVAADGETAALHAIDEFRGCRVSHAQHVGELADRDGSGLAEHEKKPQLAERQVIVGPTRRALRHELAERLNVSLDFAERYGMS